MNAVARAAPLPSRSLLALLQQSDEAALTVARKAFLALS
jgi:hypothetical protein